MQAAFLRREREEDAIPDVSPTPSRPRPAWRIAAAECARHPLRTLLVSQGMLWAVALIVIPAAVIGGSRRQAMERAGELGTDLLQVEPAPAAGADGAPREEDLPVLTELLGPGGRLSALRVEPLALPTGRASGWWIGADPSFLEVRGRALAAGRWPAAAPPPDGAHEVALEAPLAAALFGEASPLGRRLLRLVPVGAAGERGPRLEVVDPSAPPVPPGPAVQGLVVVGVVAEPEDPGVDRFGLDEDRSFTQVVHELMETLGVSPRPIPFLESGLGVFVDRGVVEGDRLDWIFLRADPSEIDAVEGAVQDELVARGRTPLLYTNAAWSILSRPELDGYMVLHTVFFWVATGIGLAVLANLLLLAGTRRRREIALRRAEGAMRRDIFGQFLWEGVLLAAVGIVLGVLVGMGLAWIRVALDPSVLFTIDWPWGTIAEGAAILVVGALVASVVPAWRASRHAPVELFRKVGS